MVLVHLFLALLAFAGQTSAATWYFLRYYTPSGAKFTSFSGDMVIPELPQAGTYYLWPGLQPTDNSGVYQNVLDGRSGTWWIGSGWCCSNPSLPWGSGFNVYKGETVSFSNTQGSDAWTSTLTRQSTGDSVTDSFALTSKSFDQVLFAIELCADCIPNILVPHGTNPNTSTGVSWDFGALEFKNVVITSTGTDSSWCDSTPENYNSASTYSISGVSASVSGSTVTCTISSVILESPA